MPENEKQPEETQFILTNLILLFIFIIVLVLGITLYYFFLTPGRSEIGEAIKSPTIERKSSTSPLPSPTHKGVIFPTLTPTPLSSPSPTISSSPMPTPMGPATLTPAIPLPQASVYRLKDWTEDDANQMVWLMNDYPNTLPENNRGEDNVYYYPEFLYAVFAQREAILRFPMSPNSASWKWGLAYNLARIGDEKAGEVYADLLAEGLNRGETDIANLYFWFNSQESRMNLFLVKMEDLPGVLESFLVEIRSSGSAFIWVLRNSSGYRAIPLLTKFDFVEPSSADWIYTDLDFDNGKEVLIYFTGVDRERLEPPEIFQLQKIPPAKLAFDPSPILFDVGLPFQPYWAITNSTKDHPQLLFQTKVFPPCPVIIRRFYTWEGSNFSLAGDNYSWDKLPQNIAHCSRMVDHAVRAWSPEAAIQLMEPLLTDWPPETNEKGEPFPLDAKDEWQYRLGTYYALEGDIDKARTLISELIANPVVENSRWVAPAEDFLQVLKTQSDIYRACLINEFCEASDALSRVISLLNPNNDILSQLWRYGVQTFSSGYFDFEQDQEPERWFTVRHRQFEPLELWAVFKYRGGVKAIRINSISMAAPEIRILEEDFIDPVDLKYQPAIIINDQYAFHIRRIPGSLEPYIVDVHFRKEYPNRFEMTLENLIENLFAGYNAEEIAQELEDLEEWPGLLCRGTWTCDTFYYFLGLARELAGDKEGAVDAYHRVWWDYSTSPLSIMARLKLIPPPTTPTFTPTQTLSPTITASTTPSPSVSPSITGSVTPFTPTPSPTSDTYPQPTTPTSSYP